jgi:multiple antibiotic resistance protein
MLGARQPDLGRDRAEREAALEKGDIAFSPLAMPMLSGPGSIAVTLGFTSLATGWVDYLAIIAGIVVMALLTYVILALSSRGMRFLGPIGVDAMTKTMGFLTMCIGVQFVVNGVLDPELLQRFRAGLSGD